MLKFPNAHTIYDKPFLDVISYKTLSIIPKSMKNFPSVNLPHELINWLNTCLCYIFHCLLTCSTIFYEILIAGSVWGWCASQESFSDAHIFRMGALLPNTRFTVDLHARKKYSEGVFHFLAI